MQIRHRPLDRPKSRDVTKRRLAAAERALAAERAQLALFAAQLLSEQETAAERLRRIDAQHRSHELAFRDLAAKQWREGRRLLRSLSPDRQTGTIEAWNRSSIPADAAYFVDFVRTKLRRCNLLDES